MAKKSKSNAVLAVIAALVIIGSCAQFVDSDEPAAPAGIATTPTPAPSLSPTPTPSPSSTPSPTPPPDMDKDGIPDRKDKDRDGDGVPRADDEDDRDPLVGEKPEPLPEPEPEVEPAVIQGVHPGGFCGNEGAVGAASNGRTYTCSGGHWRR